MSIFINTTNFFEALLVQRQILKDTKSGTVYYGHTDDKIYKTDGFIWEVMLDNEESPESWTSIEYPDAIRRSFLDSKFNTRPTYDSCFYSTLVNGALIQDTKTGTIYYDHKGQLYETSDCIEWIPIDSFISVPEHWVKLENTRDIEDSFCSSILDSEPSKHNPSLAETYLKKSMQIMEERGKEYNNGASERSFNKVAIAFNAITGKNLTPAEVCLLLQILKDVRQWTSDRLHADSIEDCITYAALKAEELCKQYTKDR